MNFRAHGSVHPNSWSSPRSQGSSLTGSYSKPVLNLGNGRNRAHCNENFKRKQIHFQGNRFDYWCDPCDRGFNSEEQFNIHNNEHQKCGIDGCNFTAHVNVVTKHIQMQHSTGLYKKICKTDTPEDIENWIRERKKNYPSRENIEKKKLQEKECVERGEKLKDDNRRFSRKNDHDIRNKKRKPFGDRTGDNCTHSKLKRQRLSEEQIGTHKKKKNEIHKSDKPNVNQRKDSTDEEKLYHNLKAFRGTSHLIREDICEEAPPVVDSIDIEDDEWKDEENSSNKLNDTDKPLVCNALANLISAYDSSDDEGPVEEKIIKDSNKETNNQQFNNSNNTEVGVITDSKDNKETELANINGNCNINTSEGHSKHIRHRKSCVDSTKNEEEATGKNNKDLSNNNISKTFNQTHTKMKRKYPKTLLEKLLEKDVRHERNIILQCVHYIVKNNLKKK